MRKIIQISESISDTSSWGVTALCDDGTLWSGSYFSTEEFRWKQLPNVPQEEKSVKQLTGMEMIKAIEEAHKNAANSKLVFKKETKTDPIKERENK
jgi:hypothetical protein